MASEDGHKDRVGRSARNQALFRRINERLATLAETFEDLAGAGSFACECADASCIEQVSLSVAEYEAIRAHSTHFAVMPGHVVPDIEDIVSANSRYMVVAKRGEAARIVEAADPRASTRS